MLQLTEEVSQLSAAHKQQMLDLQAKLHDMRSSQTSDTNDEMTECKRHSCGDIQQYLQGGLRALEDRCSHVTCFVTLLTFRFSHNHFSQLFHCCGGPGQV